MLKLLLSITLLFAINDYKKIEFSASEGSKIVVKGTSTLHDWDMVTTKMESNAVLFYNGDSLIVDSFEGSFLVKDLKSGKKEMDKNAYKALDEKKHSKIQFNLIEVQAVDKSANTITALFSIEVKGTIQEKVLQAQINPMDENIVNITGSAEFKMTDFNVKPPVFMLGALRTGNEITIDFNLNLATTQPEMVKEISN